MYLFFQYSDADFDDLESRAQNACIVFEGQEMPPRATPHVARVGFEVNDEVGVAILYVDRGVTYIGDNPDIGVWLRDGEKRFARFSELRNWIRQDLRRVYETAQGAVRSNTVNSAIPSLPAVDELTDVAAVKSSLPNIDSPTYIAEDDLFDRLRRSVRGQDPALVHLASRVCRHLARRSPSRPATFFAIGPTGVGKTKTAEVLCSALGDLDPGGAHYNYARLDMSEYQERYRVSQLLGAPQGYVGYGQGSQLVDALVANPKTIVLFDEIDKAHPDILRTLMNAIDAGRLSSAGVTSQGREIDCRHAIFIFTSNLDFTAILRDAEAQDAFRQVRIMDDICRVRLRGQHLPSELIGRIGTFLIYQPLNVETRAEIVALAIHQTASEYGLNITYIEPSVVTSILAFAPEGSFGARPDNILVDDVLGEVFAAAAATHTSHPMEVRGGPPYRCVPSTGRM